MAINILQSALAKVKSLANSYINKVAKPMAVGVPQVQQFIQNNQRQPSPVANIRNPQISQNAISSFTKPFIQNRYVAPVQNIPNAFNQTFGQNKSWGERGMGALGLLGGAAT